VQRRAALEEEHLVIGRNLEQLAEILLRYRRDLDELLARGGSSPSPTCPNRAIEHFGSGVREHLLGQDRGRR